MVGDDRYEIIEVEPPRRRGRITMVIVAALVAVPLVGLVVDFEPAPIPPVPGQRTPGPTPQPALTSVEARPNVLYPEPRPAGDGRESLDVTFPDGSRARVSYPASLDLAGLGVRPAIGVRYDELGVARRLYAPLGGEVEISGGSGEKLRDLTGNVALWPRRAGQPEGHVTVYTFGRWTMAMRDPGTSALTFDRRMTMAENLRGEVRSDGYLVLSARQPVELARPGDISRERAVGPQLWFGGETGPLVVLTPTPRCGRGSPLPFHVLSGVFSGRACQGDVLVVVGAGPELTDRLLQGIQVRSLEEGKS
ncbi:hypothetical protein Misp01_14000 [Microtetraspora sp. NBRC 13810]|uniref:hypothetical protein n=1 Tax=Microtetraspora sp. NBRC 13810 TaxID=3030990 RepID=UPI0024A5B7AB|nr:hypothetical protein [Microtetraspora sp. NBRC 13810]GLW06270.1 hypothetical protein Misp01_14000 [Microtetraspora sp. NBRC 13810]